MGGGTPQRSSRAVLPAYDRKESRKPTSDPDPQSRMNDVVKADARGRWCFRVGTVNVGSIAKRSGEVSDMLCRRKVDVCGLQEVRFKNEGVRFLQGGEKMRYKMFWKGERKDRME